MTPPSPEGIPIYACALIGHTREGELLVVPHQQGWALPGAWIRAGERVEDALLRGLQALSIAVGQVDFVTVAEDRDGLVFVFDAQPEGALPEDRSHQAWRLVDQLDDLWPASLRSRLQVDPPPWLPRPLSTPGGTAGG